MIFIKWIIHNGFSLFDSLQGFDIYTAYKHWQHGDTIWFSFTVVFICVPSFVMTGVSLHWWVLCFFFLLLFLSLDCLTSVMNSGTATLHSNWLIHFRRYVKDADNENVPRASASRWAVRILFHILQLGPILRYAGKLPPDLPFFSNFILNSCQTRIKKWCECNYLPSALEVS